MFSDSDDDSESDDYDDDFEDYNDSPSLTFEGAGHPLGEGVPKRLKERIRKKQIHKFGTPSSIGFNKQ